MGNKDDETTIEGSSLRGAEDTVEETVNETLSGASPKDPQAEPEESPSGTPDLTEPEGISDPDSVLTYDEPASADVIDIDVSETASEIDEPESEPALQPIVAEPEPQEHYDEHHEEEGGASFAARALWFLILLLAGAGLGIWGGPKLAAKLPSGMAPVAEWLAPGSGEANARIDDIQTRFDSDLGGITSQLADLSAVPAGPEMEDIDAAIAAAMEDSAAETEAGFAELRDAVAAIDLSGSEQKISRIETALEGQSAELQSLKDQLTGGMAATSEMSEDTVAKIDLYQAELDGLRAELGKLSDNVAASMTTLTSRVDEVGQTASRSIETAQAKVTEVEEQAATRFADLQTETASQLSTAETEKDVSLIRAALISGEPFSEVAQKLDDAENVVLPAGLLAAADSGVPTMAGLRDRFPEAAHDAISAGIVASSAEGNILDRTSALFKSRVATRSLTPVEGSSTDAVLSRMESDLKSGDLDALLSEAEQLSSEAAGAMQDWLDAARLRAGAEAGLSELEASLSATN